MKTRILFAIVLLALVVGAVLLTRSRSASVERASIQTQRKAPHPEASHAQASRVPAFQSPSEMGTLKPTLPAEKFTGKTHAAYIVANEIPRTLAQLPCYCHCDEGFGHKSLHSCFVDDHAAHCAVCVDEALLAYRLQKEEKMTPEQVREVIIEKYATN